MWLRSLAIAAAVLALGAALGFAAGRSTRAEPGKPPGLLAEGTLAGLPRGTLQVRAERVVLPSGFRSRHFHGGPTFNFIDSGTVVIADGGRRMRYGPGDFFFEPARRRHAITVLEDASLSVIRLLPPGAEATTDVP